MFPYLATLSAIAAIALGISWRLGSRRRDEAGKLSPVAAAMLIALGILWLLAAYFARGYSDTDGFGTDLAAWFAQSGKWLVLLAAVFFGHGWICGTRQLPTGFTRRIAYYVAILGMTTLIFSRTLPVYVLLDAGRRDEAGCLCQSEKIEVTCGAVALLNYLERYRQHAPLTEREVSRICGVTPEGTTPAALVNAAHHYGLTNATARVLTLAELDRASLPAIISISTLPTVHHATLLIKLNAERAWFIDPAYGYRDVTRQRFQEIWYGKTVLLE
ncbi:MAG TPA: cysteine peptidase family C39 domain-containing protein [Candidatus Acidoferrales bacterium]|jgi:hypothetical protein|nr:cysteine peptidase family C39 domain-containing protein [Candidatus Acidoferrales bacterium]